MRNAGLLFTISLLLTSLGGTAQSLQQRVSLNFRDEPLGEVLASISRNYQVQFAYSSQIVPVSKPVTVSIKDKPLSSALDDMLAETQVAYTQVGSHIVLKVDKNKPARISTRLPESVPQITAIYQEPVREDRMAGRRPPMREMDPIYQRRVESIPGSKRMATLDPEAFRVKPVPAEDNRSVSQKRLAQISLLPFLGTNALESTRMTNHVSVNVFWGANGGVDGFEAGGFVNTIINDVRGVQVAGFGNTVGGSVTGTQVSGLFNTVLGEVQGVQVAGLFNVSGKTAAVQAAGVFNVTTEDFSGVQAAGLFNASSGAADGIQVASLFNTSKGMVKTQVASLFNVAGDVKWGQISGLLNVGKQVDGFQIGLINVADTVTGVPIGLLNLVKNGYNRVEFSGNEALYGNFALKLGARSFYNIFQIGTRWDDREVTRNGEKQTDTFTSWGLGYGFGTAVGLGSHTLLNLEAVAIHINETERWTNTLNLLSQVRLTLDVKPGRRSRTSFFAGPVWNVLTSKRFDADTGTYGSRIVPYTFYDRTRGNTNIKMWVGFTAGIRL